MIGTIIFPDGDSVRPLRQGTYAVAENPGRRSQEIAVLRLGIDYGMTLIETV